ncbi:hypothetical protein M413DRAFT_437866 [Hebeloma cylindrosporum]|uniref:Uncharacterized protein n=1 Tax=Hebeloma cylindrosporum TaxID=76867 RepID=A0A0C2Z687_HEBCY|nr:hypothetical protein M413DRAFT_437866 [Hebeloma cylindrosporum h7]
MIAARHHNNKAASIVDCTSCSRPSSSSSSRKPRSIALFNRRLRATQLNLAKSSRSVLAPSKLNGVVSSTPTIRVSLPSSLPVPSPREIDVPAFHALFPELEEVPTSYIRQTVALLSPPMLAGLQSAQIVAPVGPLPRELEVMMADAISIPAVAPSHLLAIPSTIPSANGTSRQKITLYPTHEIVLAANCTSLPSMPKSSAATAEGNTRRTVTLPIVGLRVPSPEAFPLLHAYLYTHDLPALQNMLLPAEWAANVDAIMRKAIFLRGFHANACALGVVDQELFALLQWCWSEVIRAVQQLTSTPPAMPSS